MRRSPALLLAATLFAALPAPTALADTTAPYGTASNNTPAPCPSGTTGCPASDPFYLPPAGLAALQHGTLVASRAATLTQPAPYAKATYLISYASQDSFGAPVLGTATVFVPASPWLGQGSRPVMSYQFAEDSLGGQCKPSYAMGHYNTNGTVSAQEGELETFLAQGYVVVAPDHDGNAEQFIAGQQEGHAVLDGIMATESLPAAGLDRSTRVALDGYSGGAHATAWATELAASYAPSLNIVGAIEGGTPADLAATARYNDGGAAFGLVMLATGGLIRAFPGAGIQDQLNAAGKAALVAGQTKCVDGIFAYAGKHLDDYTTSPGVIDQPVFQALLAHEKLGQSAPRFPIFNYHATSDEIVPYPQDLALVHYYCSHGVNVQHVTFAADHVSGEEVGAPLAATWLAGVMSGQAPTSTCPVTEAVAGLGADVPEAPVVPLLAVGATLALAMAVRRRRATA
ncbi:MAG: hypothetical protein QOE05_3397 [Actinomycetota bacterium]|jgi:hypothetical protein|nr:hypothetical protein [Actinomycetota bacterium]